MRRDSSEEAKSCADSVGTKRRYSKPVLQELGEVSKLTAGGGSVIRFDGQSGMAMLP